uniref:Uncharacterized protein n=1 Tax=Romanomermis culicivorax TaxID=13658 RepID=A0A915J9K7_ROMCU
MLLLQSAQARLNPLKTVVLSKALSSKVATEISLKEKKELSSRAKSVSQSRSSHVAETALAQRYSDWSRPFGSFDLRCPEKHAVRAVKIRQISDGEAFDASFSIQCEIISLNDELGEADIQILTFRPLKDGSIQSPCDLSLDQFLCGIRGIYENDERGTEAHCCRYEKVRPSLRGNPVSDKPAVNEIELKPSLKDQFIGNLDQTSDGTFVAQIIKFDIS